MNRTVVVANKSKGHGGEYQGAKQSGIAIYDFSECHLIKDVDTVIVMSGGQEQQAMLNLKKLDDSITIVWWMCDFREPSHFGKELNDICDYLFLPYYNYHIEYKRLTKNSVHYLPQCGFVWGEQKLHENNVETIFIGNTSHNKYHSNRKDILRVIQQNSKLFVLSEGGTSITQSTLYRDIPLSVSISSDEIKGGCSNRLYNIIQAGGCAFVKYFEGLEKLFNNHEHLIWFKDNKEIPELLNKYLNNRHLIDKIKENAVLISKKHTFEARLNEINKIIK